MDLHYHNYQAPRSEPTVRAVPQRNGDWILSGTSRFADNVPLAKLLIVEVAGDSGLGDTKTCTLLITPDMDGVEVEAHPLLMCDEASGAPLRRWAHGISGRVVFTECRVPASNVMPATSAAHADVGRALSASPLLSAINVGIGRSALTAAVDYAKLRVQGGRRIVEHQAIGEILADCAIHLETARNTVWKAAWACEHPQPTSADDLSGASLQHIAKVFTSEAVQKLTLKAAECFGAMGIMLDMPMTRYVRDARVFLYAGRSNLVDRFRIAEDLTR